MSWPVSDRSFILAKLDANGISRQLTKPETLLRRLYFDLIGLPPTPKDIRRYAAAWKKDPKIAYQKEVEKLLSTERFG